MPVIFFAFFLHIPKKYCTFAAEFKAKYCILDIMCKSMFNFTPPHIANGHYLVGIKIIATRK